MTRRAPGLGIVLLAGVIALTSCGTPGGTTVDEELDLAGAKRTAMEMELELASFVPANNTASVEQQQEGPLLSCDGDRSYQWTGQTKVILRGQSDTDAIVDAVVAEYSDNAPYSARLETTSDGVPSAHVLGPHGAGYLVTESVDHLSMEILSFSPCFRLSDDLWHGDRF